MSGPLLLAVAAEPAAPGARRDREAAAAAARLAAEAGGAALGLIVGDDPGPAAAALADLLPRVVAVRHPAGEGWSGHAAAAALELAGEGVTHVVVPSTVDGRDLAGILVARLEWGILANAEALRWADGRLAATAAVLGGRAVVLSALAGERGIVTVRDGIADAAAAGSAGGRVEERPIAARSALPPVRVHGREGPSGDGATLEEAAIVVVAGRGVGGPHGVELAGRLAAELGGVLGASRAAVDSGWVPYAQQVGQTGRAVRPALYLGLGVSMATQHRVGIRGSGTIVVVNRDPDAPAAEIADLMAIGDLHEVVPALIEELRARRGG